MFDGGPFEAITHAVAGRRNSPLAVKKQVCGLAELVVLRSHHDADRAVARGRQIDGALGPTAWRRDFKRVPRLQRARPRAAEAGAGVDRKAAEHWFALHAAF